jgi:sugar-phosphatase
VVVLECRALLFDLDGTLVDSREPTERHWRRWAEEHGVDWPTLHDGMLGVPSRKVIARFAPNLDAAAEADRMEAAQAADAAGVAAMPGAAVRLASIPAGAWAVVTAASRALAVARLEAAGLAVPGLMITADDIRRGKPDPEPYLLAAGRIGIEPAEGVVVEDAPAGVAAGRAGGFTVIGVGGPLSGCDLEVPNVGRLAVEAADGCLRIRVRPPGGPGLNPSTSSP